MPALPFDSFTNPGYTTTEKRKSAGPLEVRHQSDATDLSTPIFREKSVNTKETHDKDHQRIFIESGERCMTGKEDEANAKPPLHKHTGSVSPAEESKVIVFDEKTTPES